MSFGVGEYFPASRIIHWRACRPKAGRPCLERCSRQGGLMYLQQMTTRSAALHWCAVTHKEHDIIIGRCSGRRWCRLQPRRRKGAAKGEHLVTFSALPHCNFWPAANHRHLVNQIHDSLPRRCLHSRASAADLPEVSRHPPSKEEARRLPLDVQDRWLCRAVVCSGCSKSERSKA